MAEILDQHQDTTGTFFGFGEAAGTDGRGQKFTCGITGQLTRLGFNRAKGSQGLKICIDTLVGGVPEHNVANALFSMELTNAQITSGYATYAITGGPILTSGIQYCFYMYTWNTTTHVFTDDYQDCNGANPGSGSRELTSTTYDSWFTENLDWNYATYMTPLDKIGSMLTMFQ